MHRRVEEIMSEGDLAWGVLGAARIAEEQVIPAIRRSGAGAVVAVSSASGRAPGYARRLEIDRAYDSHEELLADAGVDAVYVALPNSEHAAWVEHAAAAGKHVLCEKPMVMGPAQLEGVERAAEAAGVVVAEAFMYRHHPQLQTLRRLCSEGDLGDLVALEARLHFDLDRRDGADDIRLDPSLGGGSLRDLGCYCVDLFGMLTGAEPDEVSTVFSRDRPDGVETRLAAALRYGPVLATFDCSFDAPFRNSATVIGTRGAVTLTDVFRADRHDGVATLVVEDERGRRELSCEGDQYAEQVRAFAAQVARGERDEPSWDLTGRTVRTVSRLAATVAPT